MDTTQLDRITHEDSMKRLLYWKDKYNITIQIYLGDYNIYIDKPKLEGGEVSLYNRGGYETIWQAINEAVNWLEEKNPVRDGQNLIMEQPTKVESENGKLPIPHVSGSLPSNKELEDFVENISRQIELEPADDLWAKMCLTYNFVKAYVKRRRQ